MGLLGSSLGAIIGRRRECFPAIIVPSLSGRVLVSIMVMFERLLMMMMMRSGVSWLLLRGNWLSYRIQLRYDMLKLMMQRGEGQMSGVCMGCMCDTERVWIRLLAREEDEYIEVRC